MWWSVRLHFLYGWDWERPPHTTPILFHETEFPFFFHLIILGRRGMGITLVTELSKVKQKWTDGQPHLPPLYATLRGNSPCWWLQPTVTSKATFTSPLNPFNVELVGKSKIFSDVLKCIHFLLSFFVPVMWKSSLHNLVRFAKTSQ